MISARFEVKWNEEKSSVRCSGMSLPSSLRLCLCSDTCFPARIAVRTVSRYLQESFFRSWIFQPLFWFRSFLGMKHWSHECTFSPCCFCCPCYDLAWCRRQRLSVDEIWDRILGEWPRSCGRRGQVPGSCCSQARPGRLCWSLCSLFRRHSPFDFSCLINLILK